MATLNICVFSLQSTSFGYLRSNFEYIRGNFRKANKILGSTPQTQELTASGESLPVMYFNNLGCTHFHMRKHHLGAFYFRKAINSNENVIKEATKSEPGMMTPAESGLFSQVICIRIFMIARKATLSVELVLICGK